MANSGGDISITISSSSDPDRGAILYYYSTSETGTKKSIEDMSISSSMSSPVLSETYYIWSQDSCGEYCSTPTSITFKRDIIKSVLANPQKYKVGNDSVDSNRSYASIITPTLQLDNVVRSAQFFPVFKDSQGHEIAPNLPVENYSTPAKNITMQSYNMRKIFNDLIDSVPSLSDWGWTKESIIYYHPQVLVNDGATAFGKYTSNSYALSGKQSIVNIYNQHGNNNVTNTTTDGIIYFDQKFRVYIPIDKSLPNISVIGKIGSTEKIGQISATGSTYCDITFKSNDFAGGNKINLLITTADDNNNGYTYTIPSTQNLSLTKVTYPSCVISSVNKYEIYPFTATSSSGEKNIINCGAIFGTNYNPNSIPQKYCVDSSSMSIDVYNVSNNKKSYTLDNTWASDTNSIKAQIAQNNMYNFSSGSSLSSTRTGIVNYGLRLVITNRFGTKISSNIFKQKDSHKLSFNFNEEPLNATMSDIKYINASSSWSSLGSNKLQQDLTIRLSGGFRYYTAGTYTIKINRRIHNNETNPASITTKLLKTITNEINTSASNQTALSQNWSYNYTIPEITSASNWSFSVDVSNDVSSATVSSSTTELSVIKQISPFNKNALSKLEYVAGTGNGKASYTLSVNSSSIDSDTGTITYTLYDSTNNTDITRDLTPGSSTINLTSPIVDSVNACIKATSRVSGLIDASRIYFSNYKILFKQQPTVAYRKNALGINTEAVGSTEIININTTDDRKNIIIRDSTASDNRSLKIDLANGVLTWTATSYPDKIIDFKNGKLIGFSLG